MALYPKVLFEVYRKTGDGEFSLTPLIYTDFVDLSFRGGIETTKDVIIVKFTQERVNAGEFTNFLGKNNRFDNIFSIDDEVKIYGYYRTLPVNKDDALIIAGRVASFDYSTSSDKLLYTMKIINRTEELLNTMTPFSTRSEQGITNTCPTAIRQMVNRINKFHGNDPKRVIIAELSSGSSLITGSPGKIQALRSDGTPFPVIDYNETWKPVYYNIEKLSSPDYTSDDASGEYIYYITYSAVKPELRDTYGATVNELVWKSKSLVSSGSLYENRDFTNIKINLDVKEIQNVLIVNAGTDRRGAGITGVAYNLESVGKYGAKIGYYMAKRQVFSKIHTDEIKYVSGIGKFIDPDGMPSNSAGSVAYPVSMSFSSRDSFTGSFTGSILVARNKDDWNQYLRDESRWQATEEANGVLEKLGTPRYTINGDLVIGSNNIVLGDIYDMIIPSYGWEGTITNPSYKLRVKNMSHTFNNNGWTSQLEAEEDEKVISEYLGNSKSNVG